LSLPQGVSPSPQRVQSPPGLPARSSGAPPAPAAVKRVSPTAKTQDLGIKPAPGSKAKAPNRAATPAPRPQGNANTSPRRASPITVPDSRPVTDAGPEPASGRSTVTSGVRPSLKQTPTPTPNGRVAPPVASAMGSARLVAISEGAQFGLNGSRVVIGRSLDPADLVDINLSRFARGVDRVSRRHAEIIRRGADYFIRDLGSLNGTYIAGRGRLGRDQLYRLNDRDEIILGGARLEFRKG
jgi:hypothetical protein